MSVLEQAGITEIVDQIAALRDGPLTILEAGSGRYRHWPYPERAKVTGLDISKDQLDANDYAAEKILGDVQTWSTDRQWDVVVSVFVLEHVRDPQTAVANMLSWTRPDGLLIIAVPNALSLKGLVTKFTPFGFHRWFYRHVYRRPHAIFPTIMDWSITPANLRKQLAGNEIILEKFSGERLGGTYHWAYVAMVGALRILTLGRWRAGDSNYVLVLRRSQPVVTTADREPGT